MRRYKARRRRHSVRRSRLFNSLFGRRHRRSGRRHRSYNRRRHHRRSRRYNTGGGALSIKRPFAALKTGFSPALLTKGAVVVSGFVANSMLIKQVNGLGFIPAFLKDGPGAYAVGLGTAGLAGALTSLAMPGYGMSVAFGGVLQQLIKAYNQYVAPMSNFLPKLGDFDDYADVNSLRAARPLGDYLTPLDAANARPVTPLGNMSDEYIGEELASL